MGHKYKELIIWKRSKQLSIDIYKITSSFPREEKFGMIDQIRRAAISVVSNIAEGCGRGSNRQLIQFLNYSQGSLAELETQIIISKELKFIDREDFSNLSQEINELQKMISVFRINLKI